MQQPCSAACTRPLQQFEVAEVQILQYAALVELLVVTTCNADLVHSAVHAAMQGHPPLLRLLHAELQWSQCHNANIEPNYRLMQISV